MGGKQPSKVHTFDVDNYLNRFVPRPRFDLLPTSISYWFGYRAPPTDESAKSSPSPPVSVLLVWLFTFIGSFSGIAILANVFRHLPLLDGHQAPIFASFGAAAILEYNAIESPLSQPRNLIIGHVLSAAIGVGITRLFELLPPERFMQLQWLAAALAVAVSGTVMSVTKTVHPPAGATALLTVTSPQVMAMGWWAVALALLAATLMLVSAMLINNLYKRFPIYWWTPVDLGKQRQTEKEKTKDVEKAEFTSRSSIQSSSDAGLKQSTLSDTASTKIGDEDADTVARKFTQDSNDESQTMLRVHGEGVVVPDWFKLSPWETQVLEGFQMRLRNETASRSQ